MKKFFKRLFGLTEKTGPVQESVTLPEPPTRQYAEIMVERRVQYAKFLRDNKVPEVIRDWAGRMSHRYGRLVKVWHNELDWISALYVVRWGEAVEHWPAQLTEKDIERAFRWEKGETPAAITYLKTGGD